MTKNKMKIKRCSMHFNKPTWDILAKLAKVETKKQGFTVTSAMYVRQIVDKHLKRKGL